jgi:hypothetical protein
MRIELFFSVGKKIGWFSNLDRFTAYPRFLEMGSQLFRCSAF